MKVLYICTHNRCRSILCEAITGHMGKGKIVARSAGSQPVGEVHPLSLRYLQETGIPVDGLRSQSWDEFEAFAPDIVITVCDSAANESCPVWFGDSVKLHWGLQDPSRLEADNEINHEINHEMIADAFRATIKEITARVELMLTIDFATESIASVTEKLIASGASQ